MRAYLSCFLVAVGGFAGLAEGSTRSLRSPLRVSDALIQQDSKDQREENDKLIPGLARRQWAQTKKRMRVHMLAREVHSEEEDMPVEGCTACFGVQVAYGKYQTEDGDQSDNSYFVFKSPAHKEGADPLPIIIHFHHGGFFSGEPWKKENEDIKSYLSKGFAVVSIGYRLVTEKYVYTGEDGENKTEELIHVDKDGKLSLDDTGKTMEDYNVHVGKAEVMTKYLYDATQAMENLIENAEKFGLDVHRIVFVGESSGGAAIQYLTWVHHQWNKGRYTPRGMVYHNAQLNFPIHNMLNQTWSLFSDTMGPKTKLADVMSKEACPVIIGNHLCGSPLGETSDYELCNHVWNKRALKRFCGEKYETATLEEVQKEQVWKTNSTGLERLWYNSENIQKHLPHDPFYMYIANSKNGTSAEDVAHHSIFALNFAKYAEMGKQGGLQYTVYYTDFAHMSEDDQGMQRFEISSAPGDLAVASDLALPPSAWPVPEETKEAEAAAGGAPGAAPAPGPISMGPGPAPAPAPGPAAAGNTVFNYLSTHNWREDFAGREVEAASREERILYACLAAEAGPFRVVKPTNKTDKDNKHSGSHHAALSGLVMALVTIFGTVRP